jgi:hypothetical protein
VWSCWDCCCKRSSDENRCCGADFQISWRVSCTFQQHSPYPRPEMHWLGYHILLYIAMINLQHLHPDMNCSHKHARSHVVARSTLLSWSLGPERPCHLVTRRPQVLPITWRAIRVRLCLADVYFHPFSSRILLENPHITLQSWRFYIVAGPVSSVLTEWWKGIGLAPQW